MSYIARRYLPTFADPPVKVSDDASGSVPGIPGDDGPPIVAAGSLPDLGTLTPNVPIELTFRYTGGSAFATARTFYPPRIHELVDIGDATTPVYGTVVDVVHRTDDLEIVLVRGDREYHDGRE